MELGPRDLENGVCVLVRRDTKEKVEVSLDEVEDKAGEILEDIQKNLYEKAKAHLKSHIYDAYDYEQFCEMAEEKPGFIRGMWCGERECEDKIKEDTTATSRLIPLKEESIGDTCVCCKKPAKKLVYWGKAY